MTPTDVLPPRVNAPAEVASARGVSAKSGKDEAGGRDAGFRDVLKQMSGDKEQPKKAGGEETDVKGAAPAHVTGRNPNAKSADAPVRLDNGVEGTGEESDADAEADLSDAADSSIGTQGAGIDTSLNAVAMLMSLANKGESRKGLAANASQAGGSSPDATLGADAGEAAAVAGKALRDVKIVSVKVETHFAAVGTDVATSSFAKRLVLAQMSNGGGQPKSLESATGKQDSAVSRDLSGATKGNEAALSRGQMVAGRTDRHGADSTGTGSGKSGSEGKSSAAALNAVSSQRAASANPDAGQAAAVQTPLQQLSSRLLATAHEVQQAASSAPTSGATTGAAASAPPVRVLSINLHPEELGSVTIRMSMVAGSLDVQIDADMPDTAQMLRTDTDQISDMLRSAGIQVDGITVRAASPDFVSTSGGSSGSYFDQQSQSQSGGAQPDARGYGSQRRGEDPSQSFSRPGTMGPEDESRSPRGNGRAAGTGLYV